MIKFCEFLKLDLLQDTLLSTTENTDNLLQGLKKLEPKIDFRRSYNEYWSLDTLSQLEEMDILYLKTTTPAERAERLHKLRMLSKR